MASPFTGLGPAGAGGREYGRQAWPQPAPPSPRHRPVPSPAQAQAQASPLGEEPARRPTVLSGIPTGLTSSPLPTPSHLLSHTPRLTSSPPVSPPLPQPLSHLLPPQLCGSSEEASPARLQMRKLRRRATQQRASGCWAGTRVSLEEAQRGLEAGRGAAGQGGPPLPLPAPPGPRFPTCIVGG